MTYEKLNGAISVASNTPGMPTGYGVQAKMLTDRLLRHNVDVAILSNYGLEGGMSTYKSKFGTADVYPRGLTLYSSDVMQPFHMKHLAGRDIPNFILTLYDVWVYLDNPQLTELDFVSWTPIDHISIPAKVEAWSRRPNVYPLAMSPFGQKAFEQLGIESTYIPHAVDTKVYKPTHEIDDTPVKKYFGLKESDFVVGMVAANKANGQIHRKAYAENLLAFSIFKKSHPDAFLYIHADPSKAWGGFGLANLAKACGIDMNSILFPDPDRYRFGYSDTEMAALYTGMDVLLHASYGEGFGVPAIEAQACGTKVIASNWAASQDMVADDGWLIEGQPFWDEAQLSFFQIPLIPSLIQGLENAYKSSRGDSKTAIEFASQFDVERVWKWYWMPFLRGRLK
jgi:glycosyltransferase involved in cell wall biosynthesis